MTGDKTVSLAWQKKKKNTSQPRIWQMSMQSLGCDPDTLLGA